MIKKATLGAGNDDKEGERAGYEVKERNPNYIVRNWRPFSDFGTGRSQNGYYRVG